MMRHAPDLAKFALMMYRAIADHCLTFELLPAVLLFDAVAS
jgi:hypothetical protein